MAFKRCSSIISMFMSIRVIQHLSLIYHLFQSVILLVSLQMVTSTASTSSTSTGEDDVRLDCDIESLTHIINVLMKNTVVHLNLTYHFYLVNATFHILNSHFHNIYQFYIYR